MSTNLRTFPFDDSGNTIHVLTGTDNGPAESDFFDYECTELEFSDHGVFLTRTGVDRVFVPYSNIRRIYQEV